MIDYRIIWAAGFFDGEGCICILRNKNRRYGGPNAAEHRFSLAVTATQKVRDPLLILQELFGGGVHQAREDLFRWNVSSQKAREALTKMLPYLVVKREQAEIAIGFQDRRLSAGGHRLGKSCEEIARDEADRSAIIAIKHATVR